MTDFFSRFRASHRSPLILPALFALGISFITVAQMRGTPIDMKTLSANVVGGLEQKVDYGADLLMQRSGATLIFSMGQDAGAVKSLYFSVLGDPSVFTALTGKADTSINMNDTGVALVRVNLGRSMKAGEVITTLDATLSGETPLTVIDAGFSSESGEYSLSVKGE